MFGIDVEEVGGLPSWTAQGTKALDGPTGMQGEVIVVKLHGLNVLSMSIGMIHCCFYVSSTQNNSDVIRCSKKMWTIVRATTRHNRLSSMILWPPLATPNEVLQ